MLPSTTRAHGAQDFPRKIADCTTSGLKRAPPRESKIALSRVNPAVAKSLNPLPPPPPPRAEFFSLSLLSEFFARDKKRVWKKIDVGKFFGERRRGGGAESRE